MEINKKKMIFLTTLFVIGLLLESCMVPTIDPHYPIEKLGIVIAPGEIFEITNEEYGNLKVENVGDTTRKLTLGNEKVEIELNKSKSSNGIFRDGRVFEKPLAGFTGGGYVEQTVYVSASERDKYIKRLVNDFGYSWKTIGDDDIFYAYFVYKRGSAEFISIRIQKYVWMGFLPNSKKNRMNYETPDLKTEFEKYRLIPMDADR